jgi:putative ABC transport system ATP-binding protein
MKTTVTQEEISPLGTAAAAIDLVKVYGAGDAAVRALDGVTAEFVAGRLTAIIGPSGSGKSTLLHCMAGLDRPTLGPSVHRRRGSYARPRTKAHGPSARPRRVHLPDVQPDPHAERAGENPASHGHRRPQAPWGVGTRPDRGRWARRPTLASAVRTFRRRAAAGRSGRALASRPAVVFADEPTGNLDSRSSAQLLEFLRQAVDRFEQTVVMVTHDAPPRPATPTACCSSRMAERSMR